MPRSFKTPSIRVLKLLPALRMPEISSFRFSRVVSFAASSWLDRVYFSLVLVKWVARRKNPMSRTPRVKVRKIEGEEGDLEVEDLLFRMGDEHDGEPLLPLLHDVLEEGQDGHPEPPQRRADPVRELLLDLLVLGDGQGSSFSCDGVCIG